MFRQREPGKDVVAIQVLRQSGANTVKVADNVRALVGDLNSQLPPGVQLLIVHDISDFIKASVHSLIEHLIGPDGRIAKVWDKVRVKDHVAEVLEAANQLAAFKKPKSASASE